MSFFKRITFVCALAATLAFAAFATNPIPASEYEKLDSLIVNGTWTSLSEAPTDRAIYMFHLRSCPFCKAFLRAEKTALLNAGVDIRVFPFPGGNVDADIIAHLAFTRDKELMDRYDRNQPIQAPDIDSSQEYIDAFNANRNAYLFASDILKRQGQFSGTPLFVYQDRDGKWQAIAGYSEERFAPVKADLLRPLQPD